MAQDLTAELTPMDVASRIGKLVELLSENECDALLVTNLTNVRYLTGFSGSAALLTVTNDGATLTTDGRYKFQSADQLEASGAPVELVVGGLAEQKAAIVGSLAKCSRIGLESLNVTWSQQQKFDSDWFADADLVSTTSVVEKLRVVKDAGEIDRVRRACHIADAALNALKEKLATNISEKEFAVMLDFEMRRLGADGNSFETIVASGVNGAKAHHHPSDRIIEQGDFVVVDFGCIVDGYCSDTTRTFCIGQPSNPEQKRMYDVVLDAQLNGVQTVRSGTKAGDVDKTCRDIISGAGWGDEFAHSTGHGVGLDVHEEPWVAANQEVELQAGNIVTVEPGVYIGTIGGVRIEDTVAVTPDGCEILSEFPKELTVI